MIDEIPADVVVEMTAPMDRAFRAAGCVPECHCCAKPIRVRDRFQLAFCEKGIGHPADVGTDEMLCEGCDVAALVASRRHRRPGETYNPHKHFGPDPQHGRKGIPGEGGAGFTRVHR